MDNVPRNLFTIDVTAQEPLHISPLVRTCRCIRCHQPFWVPTRSSSFRHTLTLPQVVTYVPPEQFQIPEPQELTFALPLP